MVFNKELAYFIVSTVIGVLALVSLNLLWIFGFNSELRGAVIVLNVAFVTLMLNNLRKVLQITKTNGV